MLKKLHLATFRDDLFCGIQLLGIYVPQQFVRFGCMWHFPLQHNAALRCVQHSVLIVQARSLFQLGEK